MISFSSDWINQQLIAIRGFELLEDVIGKTSCGIVLDRNNTNLPPLGSMSMISVALLPLLSPWLQFK